MESERLTYGQYCPLSRALDVLGERWSFLILRDLTLGTTRFNDLSRGLPGLSRSLLAKRLRRLVADGLVERLDGAYLLTDAGRALQPVLWGLGEWGSRWAFGDPQPTELDPDLLAWWMHARLDTSDWPGHRHVIELTFADHPRRFWFVIERGTPSVCRTDPGYAVDVVLRAELAALYLVWLGRLTLSAALRDGRVTCQGPAALTRRLGRVLQLSPLVAAPA